MNTETVDFIRDYIAKNKVERIVLEVQNELNEGYSKKRAYTGVKLLNGFVNNEGRSTVDSLLMQDGRILVLTTEQDGAGGVLEEYNNYRDFADQHDDSDVIAAVAEELGQEYVEEMAA